MGRSFGMWDTGLFISSCAAAGKAAGALCCRTETAELGVIVRPSLTSPSFLRHQPGTASHPWAGHLQQVPSFGHTLAEFRSCVRGCVCLHSLKPLLPGPLQKFADPHLRMFEHLCAKYYTHNKVWGVFCKRESRCRASEYSP